MLLLLGWRAVADAPTYGLDPSWSAALHMAAHSDLRWGSDLLFTYGPLGWLRDPTYWYEDSGRLALAWVAFTRFVTFAVLWALARRVFGWFGATVVMVPVAWLIDDPMQVLGAVGALWLAFELQRHPPTSRHTVVAAALGALAAIELLGKFNVGALIGSATIAAVLFASPGSRAARLLLTIAASGLTVLVAGWLLSGQHLGDLPSFLRGGLEVAAGYSAAMGMVDPDYSWAVPATGVLWLAGVVSIWFATDAQTSRARLALLAVWSLVSFFVFKAGTVRLAGEHWIFPFATLAPLALALPWRDQPLPRVGAGLMALLPVLIVVWNSEQPLTAPIDAIEHQQVARKQLSGLYDADLRASFRAIGLADAPAAFALKPETIEAVRGRSVDVWPWEAGVAWGLELEWRPQPIFQSYAAYTPYLDERNRELLASDRAPQRILMRANSSIDTRLASFDVPATARELLCRYRPVHQQGRQWLVIEHQASRCGKPRLLSRKHVAWGTPIEVPQPTAGRLVYMTLQGAEASGVERLRTMAFRAHERRISVGKRPRQHRFVAATAVNGLALAAGAGVDFPAGFALAANTESISIDRDGRPPSGQPLEVAFFEIRVRAADSRGQR